MLLLPQIDQYFPLRASRHGEANNPVNEGILRFFLNPDDIRYVDNEVFGLHYPATGLLYLGNFSMIETLPVEVSF